MYNPDPFPGAKVSKDVGVQYEGPVSTSLFRPVTHVYKMGFLKFNPEMPAPAQMAFENRVGGKTPEQISLFRQRKIRLMDPGKDQSPEEALTIWGEHSVPGQGEDEPISGR